MATTQPQAPVKPIASVTETIDNIDELHKIVVLIDRRHAQHKYSETGVPRLTIEIRESRSAKHVLYHDIFEVLGPEGFIL